MCVLTGKSGGTKEEDSEGLSVEKRDRNEERVGWRGRQKEREMGER